MASTSRPAAISGRRHAMQNPAFYNVSLKNFVTPWTNRDQTVFAPLNDYTATVIGMVRDDVPFNRCSPTTSSTSAAAVRRAGLLADRNDHYAALERGRQPEGQPGAHHAVGGDGIPADATAGVITTRAAAQAFFFAGTNRAMFRFTLMNHLCRDMEQVQDTTRRRTASART